MTTSHGNSHSDRGTWAHLSLKSADDAFAKGLEQSLFLKPATAPIRWFQRRLQPWVAHSQTRLYLPQVALFLTLLILFTLPFLSSKQSAILVFGCTAFTALRVLLLKEEYPTGALAVTVGLFVAWGAVASSFSPFLKLSLYGYSKTITYFLCYLCFLVNLRTVRALKASVWTLVVSALVVSVYGLYQWHIKVPPLALWDDPSSNYKITRVYSFLGNPNLLAGYLLPTLSLTAFFFFDARRWLPRLALAAAFGAQLLCMYFTYCRGAWIAMVAWGGTAFVCFLLLFWHKISQNRWFKTLLFGAVVLGCAGVVGFVLTNPALQERVRSLFDTEHSSNNFRINVWQSTIQMLKVYGLTGIGLGNKVFVKMYTYYMATGFRALSTYNIFLEIWLEMGIVGFLLFVGVFFTHAARAVWGLMTSTSVVPRTAKVMLAAGMGALVALATHGIVDTVFFRPPVQILFWYALALITLVSHRHFKGAS